VRGRFFRDRYGRVRLASGCAKADTLNPADRCFVYFLQSAELFRSAG
jgi:hypothetical protein